MKARLAVPIVSSPSTHLKPNGLSNESDEANNCATAVFEAPACADNSWVLWQGSRKGYFCCEPDQIGILGGSGDVGKCVASNVPVSATLSATRVSLGLSS